MLLLPGCEKRLEKKAALEGFIVSDAHMGSEGADQPSLETQSAAMDVILNRFTNLDVLIDTGDAHHGNISVDSKRKARKDWIERIADRAGDLPFFYVPGNHELDRAPGDPEEVASAMGSLSCRPYYSFDLFGIHFVSVPQLLDTVYVTKETLMWLDLDLSANRDKTVVILAHNAIEGTTYDDGQSAYRRVINTDELLSVIDRHPQVVAWMHGHNHQYEIVEKHSRLYVSNGRIGGFNPPERWGPFGQGHLGGIYFRVDDKRLEVRAFSASANKFMDEIGFSNLSRSINVRTSFARSSLPAVSAGYGGARDGQTVSLHQHFVTGNTPASAFVRAEVDPVINENHDYAMPTELVFASKPRRKVIGTAVRLTDLRWEFANPGLRLVPTDARTAGNATLLLPKAARDKPGRRRASYYHCQAGSPYLVEVDVLTNQSNVILLPEARFRDAALAIVHPATGKDQMLSQGRATVSFRFNAPQADGALYLNLALSFRGIAEPLTVRSVRIQLDRDGAADGRRGLSIGDSSVVVDSNSNAGVPLELEAYPVNEVTAHAPGRERLTWLIRQDAVRWQCRNARIVDHGEYWQIDEKRLKNHDVNRVVIAPVGFQPSFPYVAELQNTRAAKIWPFTDAAKKLHIELSPGSSGARVVISCAKVPKTLSGASVVKFSSGRLRLAAESSGTISLAWT